MAQLGNFGSSFHVNGIYVDTFRRKVVVDGKDIPFVEGMTGNNITTINDQVTIDGYKLVNGEWKEPNRVSFMNWLKRKK